jgi:hypothetical protein
MNKNNSDLSTGQKLTARSTILVIKGRNPLICPDKPGQFLDDSKCWRSWELLSDGHVPSVPNRVHRNHGIEARAARDCVREPFNCRIRGSSDRMAGTALAGASAPMQCPTRATGSCSAPRGNALQARRHLHSDLSAHGNDVDPRFDVATQTPSPGLVAQLYVNLRRRRSRFFAAKPNAMGSDQDRVSWSNDSSGASIGVYGVHPEQR